MTDSKYLIENHDNGYIELYHHFYCKDIEELKKANHFLYKKLLEYKYDFLNLNIDNNKYIGMVKTYQKEIIDQKIWRESLQNEIAKRSKIESDLDKFIKQQADEMDKLRKEILKLKEDKVETEKLKSLIKEELIKEEFKEKIEDMDDDDKLEYLIKQELKKKGDKEYFFEFDGWNCHGLYGQKENEDCRGWDGESHRCDCGNRRVRWRLSNWNNDTIAAVAY